MNTLPILTKNTIPQPKHLWFLILSYSMLIAMSNWYDARLVEIFNITISPGSMIFPLTFLLSDVITEVYGYKHARRAIWSAFLFSLIFVFYGQIVIHMPSPASATDNLAFDKLLSMNLRIIISSFISYLISEPINAYAVAKLKIYFHGKYMGIRFITSTIFASGIDTIVFILFAFFGVIPTTKIILMILSVWMVKVSIEILALPLFVRAANSIKKLERLDVYDENTNFSPLSLSASYTTKENKYLN